MSYYAPDTAGSEDWSFVICRATGNGLDALKKPVCGIVIPEHVKTIPPPPPEDESGQTNEAESAEEIS